MEVKDEAQALDMPNGMSRDIDYKQSFIRAPQYGQRPPRHEEAKGNVMSEVLHARK